MKKLLNGPKLVFGSVRWFQVLLCSLLLYEWLLISRSLSGLSILILYAWSLLSCKINFI